MSFDHCTILCVSALLVAIALVLRWSLERPRQTRPKAHVIDFQAWREMERRRTRTRSTNH